MRFTELHWRIPPPRLEVIIHLGQWIIGHELCILAKALVYERRCSAVIRQPRCGVIIE